MSLFALVWCRQVRTDTFMTLLHPPLFSSFLPPCSPSPFSMHIPHHTAPCPHTATRWPRCRRPRHLPPALVLRHLHHPHPALGHCLRLSHHHRHRQHLRAHLRADAGPPRQHHRLEGAGPHPHGGSDWHGGSRQHPHLLHFRRRVHGRLQ